MIGLDTREKILEFVKSRSKESDLNYDTDLRAV